MGGDLGALRGSPPKFEVRGRPMHPSPNILRSSVVGRVRKCELSEKRRHERRHERFCYEKEVLLVKKGPYTCTSSYRTFDTVKTGKSEKVSEILGVKMEIFSQNRSLRNFGVPILFRPPKTTRRQVSAYEWRRVEA